MSNSPVYLFIYFFFCS